MLYFLGKRRWQFLIFLSEFVYMGVEMVASRIMSPVFGTTLEIWSAIIGTILAASAIGNWLGGRVGDDDETRPLWIVRCLGICSFWLACVNALFATVTGGILGDSVGVVQALLVCALLFFVPGVCFGALSPLVLGQHAQERGLKTAAAGSGLYTAMTLGGLCGTFLSGFWLVPALGSMNFVFAMACLCVMLTVAATLMLGLFMKRDAIVALVVPAFVIIAMFVAAGTEAPLVGVDEWLDTEYGRVHVTEGMRGERPVRNLLVSGGFESSMYLDDETHVEPVFDYCRVAENVIGTFATSDDEALCLGGGAYSVPKWLAAELGANVEVIEIDPGVTEVARRYFFLDEVSEASKHGIVNHTGDGRVVMGALEDGSYNVIFNDTFAGIEPVGVLSTVEAAREAKSLLAENGFYVANVIGMQDGVSEQFLGWEVRTLREVFGNVRVIACYDNYEQYSDLALNWIVVATDDMGWQVPEGFVEAEFDLDGAEVLTDDDCPVEYLTAMMNMRRQ